jgi:hypothetical protein
MVAVKSLPPRPRVVMKPFASLAMKPVTIGIAIPSPFFPSAYGPRALRMFSQVSGRRSALV